MRELWRRTADLFWEHPILWLPVLAADLLGQCVTQLQQLLTHRIVLSLVERHSVLGNTPDLVAYKAAAMKAALLIAPFVWGSYFINICLYTMAFLVTARLVFTFQEQPSAASFAATLKAGHPRRIFVFALKIFAMFILAAMLLLAVDLFVVSTHQAKLVAMALWADGAAMVVSVCIAYCIVPSSLRLIKDRNSFLADESIWRGRSIAILVVAASSVIAFCVQTAEQSLLGTSPVHPMTLLALGAIASLFAAVPYVPLFIALSLVAMQDDDEVQPPVLEDG